MQMLESDWLRYMYAGNTSHKNAVAVGRLRNGEGFFYQFHEFYNMITL